MKKKITILFVVLLLTVFSSCTFYSNNKVQLKDFVTDRTDKQPILTRFSMIEDFESCLWQSAVISNGSSDFGPTSYWMQGYIVLDNKQIEEFKQNYNWTLKELNVDNNKFSLENDEKVPELKFNITNCKWACDEKFNKLILGSFVGELYFDLNNGILFFDVESN